MNFAVQNPVSLCGITNTKINQVYVVCNERALPRAHLPAEGRERACKPWMEHHFGSSKV
jgi:hypothetical protein